MSMKTLLTTAALAIAFAVPAAEARVPSHQGKSHAAASVKTKTAKKAGKAKHKKHVKKKAAKHA